jgi:hypothetical protein
MLQLSFALSIVLQAAAAGSAEPPRIDATLGRPNTVAFYLDHSSSMDGAKARAMKEGAKLAAAILDDRQRIVVIPFSTAARASAPFPLRTPDERRAAMRYIDSVPVTGGTDYLAALRAARLPEGTPSIFLSDGEHGGDPQAVLDHIRRRPPGPIHTVAVECRPNSPADQLLGQMAARTGGHHLRVDNSEALVRAFIELARTLGDYRTYRPDEDSITCPRAAGKVVAFGFDATPTFVAGMPASGTVFSHTARLPGEAVTVAALDLPPQGGVTIRATGKRTPRGRLAAILRGDLVRTRMTLSPPGGTAGTGSRITATTDFHDRDGKAVDPRGRNDLTSEYQVLDARGTVVARAVGTPHPDRPALRAALDLPETPGPVTIRNLTGDASQGPSFVAHQDRTLILARPLPLTVTPSPLAYSGPAGSFTLSAKVRDHGPRDATTRYTAELAASTEDLRLAASRSKGDTVELEFRATKAGTHRGTLIVHADSAVPTGPAHVPYAFSIRPRQAGLALPRSKDTRLGTVLAASGTSELAAWSIPGLDVEPARYRVEATDLSDGAAVIPLKADPEVIEPTNGAPASLALTGEVGNVPAGVYTGSVAFTVADDPAQRWEIRTALTVVEPVSAGPLDLGTVEVGAIAKRPLVIANAGGPLRDLRLTTAPFVAGGRPVEAEGIAVTVPAAIASLAGKGDTTIEVAAAISPLLKSRGPHQGSIRLHRAANQVIDIPIRLDVVDEGQGPAALLASPPKVVLTAGPGEVVTFAVRIKPGNDLSGPIEVEGSAGAFRDVHGQRQTLDLVLEWPEGTRLGLKSAVTAKCYLIAPDRPGRYSADLTIRSRGAGTRSIPLTLEVK